MVNTKLTTKAYEHWFINNESASTSKFIRHLFPEVAPGLTKETERETAEKRAKQERYRRWLQKEDFEPSNELNDEFEMRVAFRAGKANLDLNELSAIYEIFKARASQVDLTVVEGSTQLLILRSPMSEQRYDRRKNMPFLQTGLLQFENELTRTHSNDPSDRKSMGARTLLTKLKFKDREFEGTTTFRFQHLSMSLGGVSKINFNETFSIVAREHRHLSIGTVSTGIATGLSEQISTAHDLDVFSSSALIFQLEGNLLRKDEEGKLVDEFSKSNLSSLFEKKKKSEVEQFLADTFGHYCKSNSITTKFEPEATSYFSV